MKRNTEGAWDAGVVFHCELLCVVVRYRCASLCVIVRHRCALLCIVVRHHCALVLRCASGATGREAPNAVLVFLPLPAPAE